MLYLVRLEGEHLRIEVVIQIIRTKCMPVSIIIIGLFNIAAKGWIEQYAISRIECRLKYR